MTKSADKFKQKMEVLQQDVILISEKIEEIPNGELWNQPYKVNEIKSNITNAIIATKQIAEIINTSQLEEISDDYWQKLNTLDEKVKSIKSNLLDITAIIEILPDIDEIARSFQGLRDQILKTQTSGNGSGGGGGENDAPMPEDSVPMSRPPYKRLKIIGGILLVLFALLVFLSRLEGVKNIVEGWFVSAAPTATQTPYLPTLTPSATPLPTTFTYSQLPPIGAGYNGNVPPNGVRNWQFPVPSNTWIYFSVSYLNDFSVKVISQSTLTEVEEFRRTTSGGLSIEREYILRGGDYTLEITHIAATSNPFITLRFSYEMEQTLCMMYIRPGINGGTVREEPSSSSNTLMTLGSYVPLMIIGARNDHYQVVLPRLIQGVDEGWVHREVLTQPRSPNNSLLYDDCVRFTDVFQNR